MKIQPKPCFHISARYHLIHLRTGHQVYLFAAGFEHALRRWEEFYPDVPATEDDLAVAHGGLR